MMPLNPKIWTTNLIAMTCWITLLSDVKGSSNDTIFQRLILCSEQNVVGKFIDRDSLVFIDTTINNQDLVLGLDILFDKIEGFSISGDSTFCPGDTLTLSIPRFNQTEWSNGSTGNSITISQAGSYSVSVRNSSGCTASDAIDIDQSDPSIDLTKKDQTCFNQIDGEISVVINNSINSLNYSLSLYQDSLLIDQKSIEDDKVIVVYEELDVGMYNILLVDEFNCSHNTSTQILEADTLLSGLSNSVVALASTDTNIELNSNFEIASVECFPVDNVVECNPQLVSVRSDSSFQLELIIADATGCVIVESLPVEIDNDLIIYAPNAFSPNEDGVNDSYFFSFGSQVIGINSFELFDRWGNRIIDKRQVRVQEDLIASSEFTEFSPGLYFYTTKIELRNGSIVNKNGSINVVK